VGVKAMHAGYITLPLIPSHRGRGKRYKQIPRSLLRGGSLKLEMMSSFTEMSQRSKKTMVIYRQGLSLLREKISCLLFPTIKGKHDDSR
jgi:hypothetical protein